MVVQIFVLGWLRKPPVPSISALIQNTGDSPNADATEPNTIGLTTFVREFTVIFNPSASPERPSGALPNISMVTIGPQQPMPSPNTNDIDASIVALLKNGTTVR